jgi:hypothetical protein
LDAQTLYPPWQLSKAGASPKSVIPMPEKLLYDPLNPSLKDVVAKMDNGATGIVVSKQGLLLLPVSSILSLDLPTLNDSFTAKSLREELPLLGLGATFLVRVDDVSSQVMANIPDSLNEEARRFYADQTLQRLRQTCPHTSTQDVNALSVLGGSQYWLLVTERFEDLRLVFLTKNATGATPEGFALARIYAGSQQFNPSNVPYRPRKTAVWSTKATQLNEPIFALGYPNQTDYHLPSSWLTSLANDALLPAQKEQLSRASRRKMALDQEFQYLVDHNSLLQYRYSGLLKSIREDVNAWAPYRQAHDAYVQLTTVDASWFKLAAQLDFFVQSAKSARDIESSNLQALLDGIKKEFLPADPEKTRPAIVASLDHYFNHTPGSMLAPEAVNELINNNKDYAQLVLRLEQKSILSNPSVCLSSLQSQPSVFFNSLETDEEFYFFRQIKNAFLQKTQPEYLRLQSRLLENALRYERALTEVFPDQWFAPNADGQLRVASGRVIKVQNGLFWHNAVGNLDGFEGSPLVDQTGEILGVNLENTYPNRSKVYEFSINDITTPAFGKQYLIQVLGKKKESQYLIQELNFTK